MSYKTLYIIGNGFDLHHKLKTQYKDFKDYVKKVDSELLFNIEQHLSLEDNWSDLENSLASIDIENIINDAENLKHSFKAGANHDFQWQIRETTNQLSDCLLKTFEDWIILENKNIKETATKSLKTIKNGSIYLNFNYTETLPLIYGIPEKDIIYIHGKASSKNIILGHAWKDSERPFSSKIDYDENDDFRDIEAHDIIVGYFEKTFKPSTAIIKENQQLFGSKSRFEEIVILGHSMSEVDSIYFTTIANTLKNSPINITIAVRSHEEDEEKINLIKSFGFKYQNIKCLIWSEL